MRWIRLDIPCPPELTEIVAAFVLSETGRGASIVATGAETVVEAWVPAAEAAHVRERLSARLTVAGPLLANCAAGLRWAGVPDVDWRVTWREHFKPLRVGERLVVKPSWEPWPPPGESSLASAADVVISIDPGGAFGTGNHQTTQLALQALERCVKPGHVVIDVGCGSGILALAALALGAKQAIAVDTDRAAVECAASNLADQIALGACRLIQGDGLACVGARADVIVANISSEAAVAIGQDVQGLLQGGGVYVATGFLSDAADTISDKLAGGGLVLERTDELEGWSSLTFARRENADQ